MGSATTGGPKRCNCLDHGKLLPVEQTCDSCVYGVCPGCTYPNDLQCRRHAPVMGGTSEHAYTVWPQVKRSDWCGDYLAADVAIR